MSIFEYDEEKHLKNEREYAYNKGRTEGVQIVGFILKCSSKGDSREKTLQKLQEAYSLSKEEAEMYYTETENCIAQN